MQANTGCAFCRANRKPWSGHTVEVCVELANCVCGYCKEKGHTPKKCPKSALKKQRDEEWAKRREERKNKVETKGKSETTETHKKTWSSLVVKSLTTEEREAMEQKHRADKQREAEEKQKEYEERKKRREEAAIRAEQYYVRKMRREYGIDACDFAQAGDFWFFFVEGRKEDDSNMAKVLREDPKNQLRFQEYLKEKYWVNWLSRSEFSEDDCRILDRWRWEEEKREYEQEKREEEEVKAYLKAHEDFVASMEAKVEKGEMTQAEFNEWKWRKEIDDDYSWQAEGDMVWYAHQQHEAAFKAWKGRSEGRK